MDSFLIKNHQNMLLEVIICCIIIYNRQRERSFQTKSALPPPQQSSWMRHGDDSSFLEITGLTTFSFDNLRIALFPENDEDRILGRPQLLDH
jgi:hypothetical protein